MPSFELEAERGWLKGVRRVVSPNCDDRPVDTRISLLVIHGISLPPGQYGGPHIDQLFTNTLNPDEHPYFREIQHLRVSSHLLINRRGMVTQYVPFHKRAWHAGESEFGRRRACNDFSIGIELEGCDEQPYEQVQYQALAAVIKVLRDSWRDIKRDCIVGHCDIAPGRKTDPGRCFDWEYFFNLLV